jgi:tRNA-dihydrouridine synthase
VGPRQRHVGVGQRSAHGQALAPMDRAHGLDHRQLARRPSRRTQRRTSESFSAENYIGNNSNT